MDFITIVSEVTQRFPRSEAFGLTAQLRKAAVSIASNIAEGHARDSRAESKRFLVIAAGSVGEADTQLRIAARLGYLSGSELPELTAVTDHLAKMIRSLQKYLVPEDGRSGTAKATTPSSEPRTNN